MKKLKRISAALMVILLAGLFIAAIVLAITGAPVNQLMAVIFSIVFISVLFYAMGLMTYFKMALNCKLIYAKVTAISITEGRHLR